MALKKSGYTQGSQYTVCYTGMRGVDFSSENRNGKRYRYAYLENMYRDYSGGGEGTELSTESFTAARDCSDSMWQTEIQEARQSFRSP